ncbi:Glycerophosphoryl diester phosphodiesterase [Serinicoccus hydrothermalis]|uniref:glycerophosphodiester phosphodiesterase n=1 Tax=Serinicoccus hydrothermalis TaxID=1758689 RepID=A0A1B1N7X4_9MICO|nr:glycerophosphodiester phosphodiesterase family protein [Serinicoccus hydrothermalis]ANS77514.1 Glycerophosphoryl diester phosphodiesterase [Serinicoccus hydrothermalis]
MPTTSPLVLGHRGASGYLPEHTLAAYELAARQGADHLELDLVPTRDGVLVARHENNIWGTTDVADHPELAARRRRAVVDGKELDGIFTEDLTLEELRTLRARERLPGLRSTEHDGQWPVPTFPEIIDLRARLSEELGRTIGLYVELKHPTHLAAAGLPIEERMLADLDAGGLLSEGDRDAVWVQCFEPGSLRTMRERLGSPLRQVLLATAVDDVPADLVAAGEERTYAELLSPEGLADLDGVLDGVGPSKTMVLPWTADGALGEPTSLVGDAHAAGLAVHAWTFRAENRFLPVPLRSTGEDGAPGPEDALGDLAGEVRAYLEAGVDGIFTDHPDLVVQAVRDPDGAAGG